MQAKVTHAHKRGCAHTHTLSLLFLAPLSHTEAAPPPRHDARTLTRIKRNGLQAGE